METYSVKSYPAPCVWSCSSCPAGQGSAATGLLSKRVGVRAATVGPLSKALDAIRQKVKGIILPNQAGSQIFRSYSTVLMNKTGVWNKRNSLWGEMSLQEMSLCWTSLLYDTPGCVWILCGCVKRCLLFYSVCVSVYLNAGIWLHEFSSILGLKINECGMSFVVIKEQWYGVWDELRHNNWQLFDLPTSWRAKTWPMIAWGQAFNDASLPTKTQQWVMALWLPKLIQWPLWKTKILWSLSLT